MNLRPVLALAVTLLALRLFAEIVPREDARLPGTSEALDLLAASRGRYLPRGSVGTGNEETLSDVIYVGAYTLGSWAGTPGLRYAEVAPNGDLAHYVTFDTHRDEGDADAFERSVNRARPGAVVVVASQLEIRPAAADSVARLNAVARTLGSEVDPFGAEPVSWAIVSIRLDEHWVKITESFSRTSGVIACASLAPRIDYYAEYRGETFVDETAFDELHLDTLVPDASDASPQVTRRLANILAGQNRAGIRMPLRGRSGGEAFPKRVVWSDLPLGNRPRFEASLGLLSPGSGDVVFRVSVDGEEQGSRRVAVPEGEAWVPWELDLSAFSGRAVRFELAVTSPSGQSADPVWGAPRVLFE